jgi:hypothetical protein
MNFLKSQGPQMRRRGFLKSVSAVALVGAAGLGTALPSFAASVQDSGPFHAFSQFITGVDLNPVLAVRYLKALSDQDPAFPRALEAAIAAASKFNDQGIDAMLKELDAKSGVYATIRTVTSAWYLGVVGNGDKAQLVAFHDALMFLPTRDYVFVPTYGGGPNSWVREKHV